MPDHYYVKKVKRQIGFTLAEHPEPGCQHCQRVWRALQEIGSWILPKEIRDSDYEVSVFDQTIQYTRVRKFRPDVSLRIWIRHRCGFDREVDACEVRCLNEMTQRLVEIGAHRAQWEAGDGEDLGGLFRSAALRRYGI